MRASCVLPHGGASGNLPDMWKVPFDLGFSVFPVKKRGKTPATRWNLYQTKRAGERQITSWAAMGLNVGIATGAASGIVVLDLDSADAIEEAKRRGLPETVTVRTPRALHVYFRHPGGTVVIKNKAGLFPGADIRGDGGYVVAPGSYFVPNEKEKAEGKVEGAYSWENDPLMFGLADMPDWLDRLLNPPPPALARNVARIEKAEPGTRNNVLNMAAFDTARATRTGKLDKGRAKQALAQAALDAGLDEQEIGATLASAWSAGEAADLDVSEDAIALHFTHAYGDRLRFDHHAGKWYEWTGTRWQRNEKKIAFHYARDLARQISGGVARFSKSSVANGVESFARADPTHAVTSEVWDSDPWLLGTPAGTVDLRTGECFDARQGDHITKLAGAAPEVGEPSLWLQFLREATAGDEGLIRFLRQMAGYCLTGRTNEHVLFFIYGPGGNGKSVFLNILNFILGDYATTSGMDTFTASKNDRHPTDLAMLKGARLVSASETEEGRAWAESRIKQLTGGDKISARFMRQDFFEFLPQFKLVIVGNHAPVLANVDDAARRRFNIVPFTQRPARPDRQLEEKLKAEAGRILSWAIEGCRDWQDNGLVRPEIVQAATQDYFDDQDLFGQWLAERCELGRSKSEATTPLYNDWAEYAHAAGDDPGSQKAFGSRIKRAGFQFRKSHGNRMYLGLALKRKVDFP